MGKGNVTRGRIFRIMQALERSSAVSYILDSQHRFVYCNPAWDHFARSNQGSQLTGESVAGTDLFDVVPSVLTAYYSDVFQHVLSGGGI